MFCNNLISNEKLMTSGMCLEVTYIIITVARKFQNETWLGYTCYTRGVITFKHNECTLGIVGLPSIICVASWF